MRLLRHVLVALVVVSFVTTPAAAQQDEDSVVVTALHAIPGDDDFPADIYLNGEVAITGFTMMMRSDPFQLDPGAFDIAIYPAGADPASSTPAVAETIDLSQPGNYSLVAQLAAGGQPIIAVYANDLAPVAMGQARLVVRNTAGADAIDVLVGEETIASSLAATGEVTVDVAAGVHQLSVVPAGGGEPLVSRDIELVEGELTAVFVIAATADHGPDLAVQTIEGLQSTPSSVPTGSGGDAATPSALPALGLIMAGLVALGAAAATRLRE